MRPATHEPPTLDAFPEGGVWDGFLRQLGRDGNHRVQFRRQVTPCGERFLGLSVVLEAFPAHRHAGADIVVPLAVVRGRIVRIGHAVLTDAEDSPSSGESSDPTSALIGSELQELFKDARTGPAHPRAISKTPSKGRALESHLRHHEWRPVASTLKPTLFVKKVKRAAYGW